MKQRYHVLGLLLLAALGSLLIACDSSNPVAPPGATITLAVSPTQVSLNGSSQITVTGFKPDGNPLNPETQVNLTTDLGVLETTILIIDNNGRAQTVLRGDGRAGTATITATLPGSDTTATGSVIFGDEGIQPQLILTASPSSINIEQESTISVLARNVDQSPSAGAQVRLRSSLGALTHELLTTDSNGEAETVLDPGLRSGSASITGTVGSSTEASVDVTILQTVVNLSIFPRIVDVNDDVDNPSNTSEITVLVRDENSIPLTTGHQVRLTANLGVLDPEIVTTNANGEGKSTYIPGSRPGSDTVTSFFANSSESTATIEVRTAPAALVLSVSPGSISPGVDETVTYTAVVTDAEGLLLSNEVVQFTFVTEGINADFNPSRSVTTDNAGRAVVEVTFFSSNVLVIGQTIRMRASARNNVSNTVGIVVQ